jgi:hypothetical protein
MKIKIISILMINSFFIAINAASNNWTEIGSPNAMTGLGEDFVGSSVAISSDGNIVAVGEDHWNGGGSLTDSGRVRVYQYTGGNWITLGSSTAMTGQNTDDYAGYSVAISSDGTIVAVGEQRWSGDFGRVRVYQYTAGNWSAMGSSTAMIGENASLAGSSVAISSNGTIVAVGEPRWDAGVTPNENQGRVRVYQYTAGNWTAIGSSTAMTGQSLEQHVGESVAISSDGTVVAVGEPHWDPGFTLNENQGRVRVYLYTGGSWTAIGSPTAMTGQNAGDTAGDSVAISSNGGIVAVGEKGWSGASGRVRVYQYSGTDWIGLGSSTAMTGQNSNDQAGEFLDINSNGTIVTVSEPGWSGVRGRVRVYEYTGGNWSEIGSPTAMTGQNSNDQAGWSVAMSSNGGIVAVGEVGWSGGFSNGRVRVYGGFSGSTSAEPIPVFILAAKAATQKPLSPVVVLKETSPVITQPVAQKSLPLSNPSAPINPPAPTIVSAPKAPATRWIKKTAYFIKNGRRWVRWWYVKA